MSRQHDRPAGSRLQRRPGQHHEFTNADCAHRILRAVITGHPVSRPNAEEWARLDMLAEFRAKPSAEQFRVLSDIEPALSQLVTDWTRHAPTSQQQRDLEQWKAANAVLMRLRQLVGPQAAADDPLIRSGTARDSALHYLNETARQRGENT